jgi:flagellar biosynthesis anti-sigma factor FlgM
MTSPISNNASPPRVQQGDVSPKKESVVKGNLDDSVTKTEGDVSIDSNVAQALKGADFDQAAVESIKTAIQNGEYPLDDKKIVESFIPLEKLL